MRGFSLHLLLSLLSLLLAMPAWAANDGARGSTSTGSLEINLTVVPEVRLTGIQDLQLQRRADQRYGAATPVCVYARGASGYRLIAQAQGPLPDFTLASASDQVRYEVRFDDGSGFRTLAPATPLQALRAADNSDPDCTAQGPSSRLEVTLAASQQPRAGTYTGTLSLTVSPE